MSIALHTLQHTKQVKGFVPISPRLKLSRGQYVADDAHIEMVS
jgi:hypothetical protein